MIECNYLTTQTMPRKDQCQLHKRIQCIFCHRPKKKPSKKELRWSISKTSAQKKVVQRYFCNPYMQDSLPDTFLTSSSVPPIRRVWAKVMGVIASLPTEPRGDRSLLAKANCNGPSCRADLTCRGTSFLEWWRCSTHIMHTERMPPWSMLPLRRCC